MLVNVECLALHHKAHRLRRRETRTSVSGSLVPQSPCVVMWSGSRGMGLSSSHPSHHLKHHQNVSYVRTFCTLASSKHPLGQCPSHYKGGTTNHPKTQWLRTTTVIYYISLFQWVRNSEAARLGGSGLGSLRKLPLDVTRGCSQVRARWTGGFTSRMATFHGCRSPQHCPSVLPSPCLSPE